MIIDIIQVAQKQKELQARFKELEKQEQVWKISIFYVWNIGWKITWDENMHQREKKLSMVNFLILVHKNVYRTGFQETKIRPLEDFKLCPVCSLFLLRKWLSSAQKWSLRPYFPLIRGMFVFRSGLRFSFWALEVPEPRVRKRPLSPTNRSFSSLWVRALPVPETKI